MAKEKVAERAGENDDANPALPEDGGAAAAASAEHPFSDMIARWLDDGDKLHERVHEPNEFAVEVAGHEDRVRAFVDNARAHAQRHRRVIGGAALLVVIVSVVAFRRAHHAGGNGAMVSVDSTTAAVSPAPATVDPPAAPVVPTPSPAIVAPASPTVTAAPAAAVPPASKAPTEPAKPAPVLAERAAPEVTSPKPTPAIAAPAQKPSLPKVADAPVTPVAPASTSGATLASTGAVAASPRKAHPVDTEAAAPPLEACKAALIRQRSRDALSACSQVFGGDPRSADNMVMLARADLLAGRMSETLSLARRAVAANPRQADAYLLIGTIQQTTGQRTEARTAYETYLQLSPYGAHASDVRAILKTL